MKTTVTSAMLQVIGSSFWAMLQRFMGIPPEIPSPLPRIREEDVYYDPKTGTLTIKGLPGGYFVSVQDTNSMDGLIDVKHLLFMTKNFKLENLTVGDPIMFWKEGKTVLHQIVFIGEDDKSWFALTKGTNHFFPDFWAVRPADIISLMRIIIH